MKVIALSCPQCGGGFDVSEDLSAANCQYCGVRLGVQRPVDGRDQQLNEARAENARLLLENQLLKITTQLERLERTWEACRKELMIKSENGEHEPSLTMGLGMMIIGSLATLWGVGTLLFGHHEKGLLGLVGIIAVIAGFAQYSGARLLEEEQGKYLRKREELNRYRANLMRRLRAD